MELLPERAVLLRYDLDGKPRRGSGLDIGGQLVLTADHCAGGTNIRVVREGNELDASVRARSDSAEVDIALLKVEDLPDERLLPCALVNFRSAKLVHNCVALGYPVWKADREGLPASAHVDGFVAIGEDVRPDRPPGAVRMMTLKITTPAVRHYPVPAGELDQPGSEWAGMSGAVVLADDQVIGVVRSHSPTEGVQSLWVTPLAAIDALSGPVAESFWRGLGVSDPKALPELPFDPFRAELDRQRREALAHRARTADGLPIADGRAQDRQRITGIVNSGGRFCWVRAPRGAGKTATAVWLALGPPLDMVPISCFVDDKTSGDLFLRRVNRRLRAILRQDVGLATVDDKQALEELLEACGREVAGDGKRLMLIVDGLDEDPLPDRETAIANLLPRELPERVHLVVFSGPNPGPLPDDHPLRAPSARYDLPPAEAARVNMERAQADLDRIAAEPSALASRILSVLLVSGPLTEEELFGLLEPPLYRNVHLALVGRLRRLTLELPADSKTRWDIQLDLLKQAWSDTIGPAETARAVDLVDGQAGFWSSKGWPAATPDYYLDDGYVDMLVRRGEGVRLAKIALDVRRRIRLRATTGSRLAEGAAIANAQRLLTFSPVPPIGVATRLASESVALRHTLESSTQPEMVAFNVRRGEVRTAIEAVRALSPEADHWRRACVELVATLYLTDRKDQAERVLRRLSSDHPGQPITASVASRIVRELPELAVAMVGNDEAGLAAIAPGLAEHDAYVQFAVDAVRGRAESQLAVARVLAPRHPREALDALERFAGFSEWSAGSKPFRGSSFARVEVGRRMSDVEKARAVLENELDGQDGRAATLALALLTEAGLARELVGAPGDRPTPTTMLARFALGDVPASLLDEWLGTGPIWMQSDHDLLERFDVLDASSAYGRRADYARLLRSVDARMAERPEQLGIAVATQLFVVDLFRGEDIHLFDERFGLTERGLDAARGRAARRVVALDPRRAAHLALDSGGTTTWTFRDVLQELGAHDLGLAIEFTDLVASTFTSTRWVVLGAVGALVDPTNAQLIGKVERRLPESSSATDEILKDVAHDIAVHLPHGDERRRLLFDRLGLRDLGDIPLDVHVERAVRMAAAGDIDAALELMTTADTGRRRDPSTRAGWERLARHLPVESAIKVMKERLLPSATHEEFHRVLSGLAKLDPLEALPLLVRRMPWLASEPCTYAQVIAELGKVDEASARPAVDALVRDLEIEEAEVDEPHIEELLLLGWSAARRSLITSSAVASIEDRCGAVWACLHAGDARALVKACDEGSVDRSRLVAAWAFERPHELPAAIEAILEQHRGRYADSVVLDEVDPVVRSAACADARVADEVIDEVAWPVQPWERSGFVPLRDPAYTTIVRALARTDRSAAFKRVRAIGDDPWGARDAWEALAAATAACPHSEDGPGLADVLNEARRRDVGTLSLVGPVVSELILLDRVEPQVLVTLLAETNSWPNSRSKGELGTLLRLVLREPDLLGDVADAMLEN